MGPTEAGDDGDAAPEAHRAVRTRGAARCRTSHPNDSYSLRLVATRALYDRGAAVGAVPALAGLVGVAPLRANPHDLDELGVRRADSVRLRTASASAVLTVVPDPSLPRKVVAADFNVPLDEGTVADLIDTGGPVVELRMETP